MDALHVLEEQHRDLSELFSRVLGEWRPGRRAALAALLVRKLDAHSRAEERCLYSGMEQRVHTRLEPDAAKRHLRAAGERHECMRAAARALTTLRPTDGRFPERLESLWHAFQGHIHLEERWTFEQLKRELTDEQLDRLGDDLSTAFECLSARLRLAARQSGAQPTRLASRIRVPIARRRLAA